MLRGAGIGGNAGRVAAQVALLLLLLRVLVPPGFMPDFGALREGRIEITLCTLEGARLLVLDGGGGTAGEFPAQKDPAHGGKVSALDCPFGLAAAQAAVMPVQPPLALPRPATVVAVHAPVRQSLRPEIRGPPLGSRAPPTDFA